MNNNIIKRFFVLAMALLVSVTLCARPGPGGGPGGPRGGAPRGAGPRGGAPRGGGFRGGPGGGPGGGHHHHHHGHHHGGRTDLAIGAGLFGAGLLASAISDAVRPDPAPVVVESTPVVVTPPAQTVVVTPAPVVATGHYETQVQNVWVEGRYIDQATPQGTVIRTWQPGHYEQQSTQVWVSP